MSSLVMMFSVCCLKSRWLGRRCSQVCGTEGTTLSSECPVPSLVGRATVFSRQWQWVPIPRRQRGSKSPENALSPGSYRVSDPVGLGRDPRICISNKFPGAAAAVLENHCSRVALCNRDLMPATNANYIHIFKFSGICIKKVKGNRLDQF